MIKNLAVLLTAHVPLGTALKIIADSASPQQKTMLYEIKKNIEAGMSLSKACAQYPSVYSPMTCKLLEAGERAAALPEVLNNIADYQEKMSAFKSRILKALFYPAVVMTVAVLITIALLLFVVPQFENLFTSMGATLPFLTQTVIALSKNIQQYGWVIVVVMMAIAISLYYYADKWVQSPWVRRFTHKVYISRFSRTLAILLSSGMPLIDGLCLMSEFGVREKILRGEMLSDALQSTRRFSELMIQLIKVGEASGMLSQMLLRIAIISEAEWDTSLSRFTQLLEPCIMVLMGVLIGGLVIAMYLPVFQLGRVV